jgi:hypothetical protein
MGAANITRWGPVQLGWSGSFFQSFTHTISPGWWGWTSHPWELESFLRLPRRCGVGFFFS